MTISWSNLLGMLNFRKRPFTILLADDDEGDRLLFHEAVEESNDVKLIAVKNGDELLKTLDKMIPNLPHAVFLDLNMPVKDGHECLRTIKNNEAVKRVPVIIYSTSNSSDHLESTYADGANLFVVKPDSYSGLKTIIEKVALLPWKEYIPQPSKDKFLLE